jgi:pimeloyl-ACP methyl ester carboxylesterase
VNIQKPHSTALAYDDTGGTGRLVVMLPGAGDLRSEYRFIVDRLVGSGHRVVTADLPGHGESLPALRYTVESTAAALVDLLRELDAGPAVVVATSFPPAAAVWAAAEHPDLFAGLVAISPHLTDESSWLLRASTKALLRGPWAAGLWAKLYAGWYKSAPPADLESEIGRMKSMLSEPARRRAVRETLTADRDGVDERIARLRLPTLTVFGSRDDHFKDPAAEAKSTAERLGGEYLLVEGAGHYPHVEQPGQVADAILAFLARLR